MIKQFSNKKAAARLAAVQINNLAKHAAKSRDLTQFVATMTQAGSAIEVLLELLEEAEQQAEEAAKVSGAERYHVEPRGHGVWPYCVQVGDGTREVFSGSRKSCELIACELAAAFEDGKFVASTGLVSSNADTECPICESERVVEMLTLHCLDCDTDFAGATQVAANKRAMIALNAKNQTKDKQDGQATGTTAAGCSGCGGCSQHNTTPGGSTQAD